jgi:hypothetical protein
MCQGSWYRLITYDFLVTVQSSVQRYNWHLEIVHNYSLYVVIVIIITTTIGVGLAQPSVWSSGQSS